MADTWKSWYSQKLPSLPPWHHDIQFSSQRLRGAGVWQWYPIPESEGSRPETKLENTAVPMAYRAYRSWFPWKAPANCPNTGHSLDSFCCILQNFGSWKYILENGGRCSPSTVYWSLPRPPSRYTNSSQGEHAERAPRPPWDPYRSMLWPAVVILMHPLPLASQGDGSTIDPG